MAIKDCSCNCFELLKWKCGFRVQVNRALIFFKSLDTVWSPTAWTGAFAPLYNFISVAFCVFELTYTSTSHRRGLNPPHRVKSISMTTFTAQEIEFLQKHSNEVDCSFPAVQICLCYVYLFVYLSFYVHSSPITSTPFWSSLPPITCFLPPLLAFPPPPYQTPSPHSPYFPSHPPPGL